MSKFGYAITPVVKKNVCGGDVIYKILLSLQSYY
jgi:hypothetical protein